MGLRYGGIVSTNEYDLLLFATVGAEIAPAIWIDSPDNRDRFEVGILRVGRKACLSDTFLLSSSCFKVH
jgi:hypothetical protein